MQSPQRSRPFGTHPRIHEQRIWKRSSVVQPPISSLRTAPAIAGGARFRVVRTWGQGHARITASEQGSHEERRATKTSTRGSRNRTSSIALARAP
eukprot:707210-Pyramimonas_sp.AAC.1